MNKNLYLSAITCFTISIVFTSYWTFNNLMDGMAFNEFITYPDLVVADWVIMILCEVLFLKYFHAKKYRVAFATGLISAITFMVLYSSVFTFHKGVGSGEFINLIVTVHLIAMITFSISLVLSNASKQKFLKQAGALGIVIGGIVLSTHVIGLLVNGETLNLMLVIQLWTSRLGDTLILIFYVLNFYHEFRNDQKFAMTNK
ncbi:hypothetical protein [Ekhidna sp.]|uniref:hypothetical protein n=1 Tax=Ekhidna sp. TaxID=2608089 RepID=UPI0032991B97